jgi:hypothetical protein
MNGRILRPPGVRHSILDISQSDRDNIGELGQIAKIFLSAQDKDLWDEAGDPDFLPRVVAGAIVLERIGQHTGAISLEDDGAHLAFMTCSALAALAPPLEQKTLRTLGETLKALAMCCPVETTVHDLPPLKCLPTSYQRSAIILRQYRLIEETVSERRDITLADALALFRIFRVADSRQFSAALAEVTEISGGLRTALQRVRNMGTE